jgi:regulatory protein
MGFGSPSLKGKALQWLAQREHSRAELHSKLRRYAALREQKAGVAVESHGNSISNINGPTVPADTNLFDETHITQVLDELLAGGFQSDARTAQSMLRTKSKRYGVHRLKQQLQAKGLSAELVQTTVGDARDTELQRAHDIWQRRYGEPTTDHAQLAKQVRFLTARGFDSDVVRRVVRGLADAD